MTPLLTTFVHKATTRVKTREDLDVLKREIARETNAAVMPQNSSILAEYLRLVEEGSVAHNPTLEKVLRIRSIRSMSGIVPIGVHTKPMGCPGRCVFCPTEVRMPKSYLSKQPAVMRAIANSFDPYKMVSNRLLQLERNGHNTEKCELIVMGGTWSAHPRDYQEEFIRRCFDGFNSEGETLEGFPPSDTSPFQGASKRGMNPRFSANNSPTPKTQRINKFKGNVSRDLEEAKRINETAKHRVVGVTLETRPDWVDEEEVVRWRRYGATRTEIGVQHTDNAVLELVKRGHGIEASMHATQLFKDAGFKITYHMMPGLPGSTPEMDLAMHHEIFARPELKPDQLKIYPCLVNEHAELYEWFKDGRFMPYDDATLDELLIQIKTTVPEYVRIARLFRDFPKEVIQGGSQITNFRQKVQQEMKARGLACVCLRCREARGRTVDMNDAELVVREYDASGGKEIFLSFESPDRTVLYAFLRLRFHSYALGGGKHFIPSLQDAALIREVHTYGELVSLDDNSQGAESGLAAGGAVRNTAAGVTAGGSNAPLRGIGVPPAGPAPQGPDSSQIQHTGFGKRLMAEAERRSRDAGFRKLAVISGVGVRQYYRKLGYTLENEYMTKDTHH